jgi:hypothetical protein
MPQAGPGGQTDDFGMKIIFVVVPQIICKTVLYLLCMR